MNLKHYILSLFLLLGFSHQIIAVEKKQVVKAYIYTIPFSSHSYGNFSEGSFGESRLYKKLSKKKARKLFEAVQNCSLQFKNRPLDLRVLIRFKGKKGKTIYVVGFDKWGYIQINNDTYFPEGKASRILQDYSIVFLKAN